MPRTISAAIASRRFEDMFISGLDVERTSWVQARASATEQARDAIHDAGVPRVRIGSCDFTPKGGGDKLHTVYCCGRRIIIRLTFRYAVQENAGLSISPYPPRAGSMQSERTEKGSGHSIKRPASQRWGLDGIEALGGARDGLCLLQRRAAVVCRGVPNVTAEAGRDRVEANRNNGVQEA
ncbi:hypothetical protein CC78DRAFT_309805 [Lojkania enalia]|uniref:Uncharacterized protein n=1 Tax=Lojkania enalia TaxID=147567 RepID=A0A9P4K4D3_9PLEO|nr:hypothetical protein CC78DRAFT_309805 [Didymosphaeria enalia]